MSANTTVTVPVPSGTQVGDFLLASIAVVGGTATAPSGWTMIPELDTQFGAGTNRHVTSFWRVATASEPASYAFAGASYTSSGGIAAYSGVDTSTASSWRGATPAAVANVVASSVSLPRVTASSAGSLAVYAVGTWTTVTHSFSSGVTTACTVGGSFSGVGLAHEAVGAGLTTQRVDSFGSSQYVAGQTLVLAPSVPCGGGSLALAAPSSFSYPATVLDGTDKTATSSLLVDVSDLTGTAPGWHVSLTSTTLTNGGATLPTTAATITGVTATAQGTQCVAPTNLVSYSSPVTVPAGTTAPAAISIYSAQAGTGSGGSRLTFATALAIPANARSGTYGSTWTITAASGP